MGYKCEKCGGSGNIAAFRGVAGGTCFKCNGTGVQAKKTAQPNKNYACIYNGQTLFAKKAKSEAQALRLAIQHWRSHSDKPAFVNVRGEQDITVQILDY